MDKEQKKALAKQPEVFKPFYGPAAYFKEHPSLVPGGLYFETDTRKTYIAKYEGGTLKRTCISIEDLAQLKDDRGHRLVSDDDIQQWNAYASQISAKADKKHTHAASEITSGVLDVNRIPDLNANKITSGLIDIDRLPHSALERCVVVPTEEARLALTKQDVQLGDTVKVTKTGKMYFVVNDSLLNKAEGYEVYTAGAAAAVDWSGVQNKPKTFPADPHNHDDRYYTETEVNNKLAGKADTKHSHTKNEISDFPTSMPASDVPAWAKKPNKPIYEAEEVGAAPLDLILVQAEEPVSETCKIWIQV